MENYEEDPKIKLKNLLRSLYLVWEPGFFMGNDMKSPDTSPGDPSFVNFGGSTRSWEMEVGNGLRIPSSGKATLSKKILEGINGDGFSNISSFTESFKSVAESKVSKVTLFIDPLFGSKYSEKGEDISVAVLPSNNPKNLRRAFVVWNGKDIGDLEKAFTELHGYIQNRLDDKQSLIPEEEGKNEGMCVRNEIKNEWGKWSPFDGAISDGLKVVKISNKTRALYLIDKDGATIRLPISRDGSVYGNTVKNIILGSTFSVSQAPPEKNPYMR